MTVIAGASVSHQRASVEAIEAACESDEKAAIESLLSVDDVEEAFAIQTCNRAERYAVAETPATARQAIEAVLPAETAPGTVEWYDHEASLRHLMRVAAGLESLVMGEDQILGQLNEAYETARGVGAIGEMLETAVPKAIHVGERARAETAINEGATSLGSAAVTLAESEVDLASATGLVVGAGEMGTLAAAALARTDVARLIVANRTVPHAEHVADTVEAPAEATGFGELSAALVAADVVVSATSSPEPVLDRATLSGVGETFVVDIAQPRDVATDARHLPEVTVRDIDDLRSVTDATRTRREAAAAEVEAMIDREFERLLESFKRAAADDAIRAMYAGAELVKERELAQALATLEARGDLPEGQREAVESLAEAIVGQLLAAPTKSLREAAAEDDWTTINTALELFDPEFGPDGEVLGPGGEVSGPASPADGMADSPPEGIGGDATVESDPDRTED